jgi:hypothetical protein
MRITFKYVPVHAGPSRVEGFTWTEEGIVSLHDQIIKMIHQGNLIVTPDNDDRDPIKYTELGRVMKINLLDKTLTIEPNKDFPTDATPETYILGARVYLDEPRDSGPIGADVHLLNFIIRPIESQDHFYLGLGMQKMLPPEGTIFNLKGEKQ